MEFMQLQVRCRNLLFHQDHWLSWEWDQQYEQTLLRYIMTSTCLVLCLVQSRRWVSHEYFLTCFVMAEILEHLKYLVFVYVWPTWHATWPVTVYCITLLSPCHRTIVSYIELFIAVWVILEQVDQVIVLGCAIFAVHTGLLIHDINDYLWQK